MQKIVHKSKIIIKSKNYLYSCSTHRQFTTSGVPSVKSETRPLTQRARRDWREEDRSRWMEGRFNMRGNLHTRLVIRGRKNSRSLHHPPESLQFIERPSWASVTHSVQMVSTPYARKPISLKHRLMGNGKQNAHSKAGEGGVRILWLHSFSLSVNQHSHSLSDFPQHTLDAIPSTMFTYKFITLPREGTLSI